MNTQGWLRGYLAHKSSPQKFITLVCRTISQEFRLKVKIGCQGDAFVIYFEDYRIKLPKSDAEWFQKKSPYALDLVLLERLKEQGLEFSENRSQYIKHCYGTK